MDKQRDSFSSILVFPLLLSHLSSASFVCSGTRPSPVVPITSTISQSQYAWVDIDIGWNEIPFRALRSGHSCMLCVYARNRRTVRNLKYKISTKWYKIKRNAISWISNIWTEIKRKFCCYISMLSSDHFTIIRSKQCSTKIYRSETMHEIAHALCISEANGSHTYETTLWSNPQRYSWLEKTHIYIVYMDKF